MLIPLESNRWKNLSIINLMTPDAFHLRFYHRLNIPASRIFRFRRGTPLRDTGIWRKEGTVLPVLCSSLWLFESIPDLAKAFFPEQ